MGVFGTVINTVSKPLTAAYDFTSNRVKLAMAMNQYDDLHDPEVGIAAKTVGIGADMVNIATLNAARGMVNGVQNMFGKGTYDKDVVSNYMEDRKDSDEKVRVRGLVGAVVRSDRGQELIGEYQHKVNDEYGLG